MKNSVRITLWVTGIIVALFVAVWLGVDIVVSRMVKKEVQKNMVLIPDMDASVGGIYLDLLSGTAVITDIRFSTFGLAVGDSVPDRTTSGMAVHVPALTVRNLHYWDLIHNRNLVIGKIRLDNPQLLLYIDERHPEAIFPAFPEDTTHKQQEIWLKKIALEQFELEDFKGSVLSTATPMRLSVENLSAGCQDLAYSFTDSQFTYNDSVYSLSFGCVKAQLPDGLFAMEVHDLEHSDQGALSIGYTHLVNTIGPRELADLMKEQTAWIDMELNSVTTSPFNPIRKALAQDYSLDAVKADAKRLHLFVDVRYQPVRKYGTPQDFLMSLPVRFYVGQVNATVEKVVIDFSTEIYNRSELRLSNARAQMAHVTNRPGAIWYNRAQVPFGKKGNAEAAYHMYMDKNSTFELALNGTDIETADLNPFIRPLVSITTDCHISQLDISYKGDKQIAQGELCMQYEGMKIQVHKEDKIPYEIITKNAELFEGIANSLIPKSNPSPLDPAPRRYRVKWVRDEWIPYPIYVFGPCIDGLKMTMLPGLYMHMLVDPKKKNNTQKTGDTKKTSSTKRK